VVAWKGFEWAERTVAEMAVLMVVLKALSSVVLLEVDMVASKDALLGF